MNWNEAVEKVAPYIVKIETPSGYGTGFLCFYNGYKNLLGIATAYHVIQDTDDWQQPIRIRHYPSDKVAFLTEDERVIFEDSQNDSAMIVFDRDKLQLPENLIPLLPTNSVLPIGTEVGWLGYPVIAPHTLCFFSGNISAWQEWQRTYLIDGVAINGVSGGPVIVSSQAEGVQIIGTISAYMANNAGGGVTPGLAFAQDVSHFHNITSKIKSFEEASRKKRQLEKSQQVLPAPAPASPQEPPTPTDGK